MSARTRFAATLVDRRTALGITQRDFATAVGVDGSLLNKWERGVQLPLPKYLPKIAELLDLDPVELVLRRVEASDEDAKQARGDVRVLTAENRLLGNDVRRLTEAVTQLLAELRSDRAEA